MHFLKQAVLLAVVVFLSFACQRQSNPSNIMSSSEMAQLFPSKPSPVDIVQHVSEKAVKISFGAKYFTSYLYDPEAPKPVLYPLLTNSDKIITRGYPLKPRAGERIDHPHHVGHWLNYGDVNGLDFWNNSGNEDPEKQHRYGVIKHQEIDRIKAGKEAGELAVTTHWDDYDGKKLLEESTVFHFQEFGQTRIITRTTKLTALKDSVYFDDNKEGMIAIRTARAFEFPTGKPLRLTDANGEPMEEKLVDNTGVTGAYLSSEGIEGPKVWGKRAGWVRLSGIIDEVPISMAIIDHPGNIGYPTYWHARDYGLFAANPLGQRVFSKGEEVLNFALGPEESVTFRYQIVIHEGRDLTEDRLNQMAELFAKAMVTAK